ncbi:MAG: hypothetical protein WBA92_07655 [Pseudorhodobacter sp.]|jgi:hypothetical protein
MVVLGGFLLGVIVGANVARKRGGQTLDILQYATGFGIAFTLIAMFLAIFIERML